MYDLLCKAALRNPIKSFRVIVRVIIQVIVRVMERFYDSDDDLEAIVRAIMISHSPGLSASHWSSWVHWSTGPGSTQAGPLVHWSTGPLVHWSTARSRVVDLEVLVGPRGPQGPRGPVVVQLGVGFIGFLDAGSV